MSECVSAGFSSWDGRPAAIGKTKKTAKEFEKGEAQARRRALLHLIAAYLRDCNLHGAADALANEAQMTRGGYELCDNVDLDIILQDYQTYYQTRFGKAVQLVRSRRSGEAVPDGGGSRGSGGGTGVRRRSISSVNPAPLKNSIKETELPLDVHADPSVLAISVTGLSKSEKPNSDFMPGQTEQVPNAPSLGYYCNSTALRRPLHEFEGYTPEWRELADQVMKEVVHSNVGDGRRVARVTWSDCIGVDECVQVVKEAVVYPVRYPQWFQGHHDGIASPWRGLLLYGPPGTGKTLLAKAVASEAGATFINLTASTFVSKWRGDSEKLLKVLFDIARFYAPTTIFIDELDSLAGKHEDNQHEASKRFTSELLIQLDGLLYDDDKIFVLATTNNPWHIHNAMLRRFEKRLLVPLPSLPDRSLLFQHYLAPLLQRAAPTPTLSTDDYQRMAALTSRYSGADIRLVCKEVAMQVVRENIAAAVEGSGRGGKVPGKVRRVTAGDVERAIGAVKRTCTEREEGRYREWTRRFK